MASDLSKIISENLSETLHALLAKETSLKECTKVDKRDFENSELLKIDVEFVFDKLTSIFSFYIPASSASRIFNTMMGADDSELLLNIDDDTTDAMAEFISNNCGGLVTKINASEFEDLGKSKFSIQHKEILESNTIDSIENIYRYLIDLEGEEIVLFTQFEENFNAFITELTKKEVTPYPEEEKEPQEEVLEEKIEEKIEEKVENKEENKESDTKEEENLEEDTTDKKTKKLKLLIVIVGGLIVITILIGIVIYFMGGFDSKPIEKPKDLNTTTETKKGVTIVKYTTLKKIDFKMGDINTKRLNNKLEILTKYHILTQKELELQAQEEKQRMIQLKKEQALLKFAKANKEESIIIPEKNSTLSKISTPKQNQIQDTPIEKPIKMQKEQILPKQQVATKKDNSKLKFVLANSLKYKLFKKLVLQTNSIQARISICNNDNGKTQIFIGPFETKKLQTQMVTLIKNADTNIETIPSNITRGEFNTRCNF